MKVLKPVYFLLCVIMLTLLIPDNALAQRFRSPGGIAGWADDNNYLVYDTDKDGERIMMSVNVRTGKKKAYSDFSNPRQDFTDALPEGFSMGYGVSVSEGQKTIVLSKDNDLWSFTLGDKDAKRLTNDKLIELNPKLSPTGDKVAYTKEKDLYVYDLTLGQEKRLTFDAEGKIYNGYASWVYYEEILGRASRYAAFWWSPNGSSIAYLHTDESPVPDFIITRIDEQDGLHGTQEVVPYPKSGDPNPLVKMGVVDVNTALTVWIKTDESIDQYIAWPNWKPDSKAIMVQVLNRDQDDMVFILADINTGDFKTVYKEKRDTWIDFFTDNYIMEDGSGFIVRSYSSDWYNLYYYNWDGKLVSTISDVDWRITGILRVDEKARTVYFSGTGEESTDSHIYRVGLDGNNMIKYSKEPGSHSANISPSGKYIIDTWSNVNTPSTSVAYDKNARLVRTIKEAELTEFDPAEHSRTELVKIPSTDGFILPALITYPINFDKAKKYPVVFTIYGGPDAGGVRNSNRGTRPSWYASNGIITISVDHRASGKFGKKGLDYMHRNLGKWEMVDYGEAVKWLREKPYVDAKRMGITGSSYGGYTTAMALTFGADLWTHGIAGSSVTDWRLYDNVYTERFMDTPQDNPEGYKDGSVLSYVDKLKGKLYIVHGTADDNVHIQNSIYLISKLQDANKDFEMMWYPGGRHGWGGAKRIHSSAAANKHWLKWFFEKD